MTAQTYETDFLDWTQEQSALLRARHWEELDLEHLAEEIEDLGREQKLALQSLLRQILLHLLKLEISPTTSVHGAINMLGLAKRVKAKIFQASTSEVYGDPSIHPRELAQTILDLTGSRSSFVYEPLPQDDPRQRQPDIGLAKHHLHWEPTIALCDGLKPTIAYFDTLLSRQPPEL